jgi:hypothetical protein
VHDPHPEDSPSATLLEILENQILHILRTKRVQVEHSVDWKFDRRARF